MPWNFFPVSSEIISSRARSISVRYAICLTVRECLARPRATPYYRHLLAGFLFAQDASELTVEHQELTVPAADEASICADCVSKLMDKSMVRRRESNPP